MPVDVLERLIKLTLSQKTATSLFLCNVTRTISQFNDMYGKLESSPVLICHKIKLRNEYIHFWMVETEIWGREGFQRKEMLKNIEE